MDTLSIRQPSAPVAAAGGVPVRATGVTSRTGAFNDVGLKSCGRQRQVILVDIASYVTSWIVNELDYRTNI